MRKFQKALVLGLSVLSLSGLALPVQAANTHYVTVCGSADFKDGMFLDEVYSKFYIKGFVNQSFHYVGFNSRYGHIIRDDQTGIFFYMTDDEVRNFVEGVPLQDGEESDIYYKGEFKHPEIITQQEAVDRCPDKYHFAREGEVNPRTIFITPDGEEPADERLFVHVGDPLMSFQAFRYKDLKKDNYEVVSRTGNQFCLKDKDTGETYLTDSANLDIFFTKRYVLEHYVDEFNIGNDFSHTVTRENQ